MNFSTLQFVVAGALVAAWVWMLGRPILTNLFRRSRRDSVGHFRYQQAVLSRSAGHEVGPSRSFSYRLNPFAAWRSQAVERRRLQLMLGFAIATFVSLLLALALHSIFTRLFFVVSGGFIIYLGVAIYIGYAELRRQEAIHARSRQAYRIEQEAQTVGIDLADGLLDDYEDAGPPFVREPSVLFPEPEHQLESYDDLEEFGNGVFDDDFYEPIPELAFEPLNLDASVYAESSQSGSGLFGDAETVADADPEASELTAHEEGFSIRQDEVFFEDDELPVEVEDEVEDAALAEQQPTFTAPPQPRPRSPKRDRARPIYIEAQLDEDEETVKAVND